MPHNDWNDMFAVEQMTPILTRSLALGRRDTSVFDVHAAFTEAT
ncbi:hypothetical protein [Dokdonella soli]